MFIFLAPTAIVVTIILTAALLKVYRECMPNISDAKPSWLGDILGFVVLITSLVMSLGVGIKVANYLFG